MIRTRGAVWDGAHLVVTDELEVREPGAGEATVRVLASGVCHSDLNMMDARLLRLGTEPAHRSGTEPAPRLPIVLGHEAAGVVERVGPGVDSVHPGDAVIVASMTPCGECRACRDGRVADCPDAFGRGGTPFVWRGEPTYSYANISSFAGHITVQVGQLVASDGLAPTSAALIGCAVSTGYGVVRNVARVRPGDCVVVFGIGGIGVNVLQSARLEGCGRLLAVDTNPRKADVARAFGADDFLLVDRGRDAAALREQVRAKAGTPVDVVVECSGALPAIEAALAIPGAGGTTALVGLPPVGTQASFDVVALMRSRRIVGSFNGSIDPPRDLAAIVELARRGALDLDHQVSQVWPLDQVADAIAAVRGGDVTRAVIDLA